MRLLIGIHSVRAFNALDLKKLFKKHFGGQNPFFITFALTEDRATKLAKLYQDAGLPEGRFLSVIPAKEAGRASFPVYKKSFEKALRTISKNLGRNEKIDVAMFGGSANLCYSRISDGALKAMQKRFRNRTVNARSLRGWVYGQGHNLRLGGVKDLRSGKIPVEKPKPTQKPRPIRKPKPR